ncbi:MAG: insulinase family protein [Nanoarchaeota archaeon]|nr:insulinase family protein [Nanoarchaeota archaeon]MBU4116284.1 insulinase family protein [Nanoarchaeota archaeon]
MPVINGKYRQYELENGLVVALQNTPTQTIASKLRVNFGSSHEREGEEGMAHFLEHCLVSGGSQKYDTLTADDIRGSFGYFNAFTNLGRTFFVGQMLTKDLETWLDYTSDHTLRPRFDKERVDGERGRVLSEISDTKSNPTHYANQKFNAIFYRGHPKGKFTLGKEEVVKNADFAKISGFHSRGFHPNNMDLVIVGGLPKNIEYLVHQYFGAMPKGENTRKIFPEIKPIQGKKVIHRSAPERYNADNPEESSAQILLASTCPAEPHQDEYALRTMSQILGGDTNSFLFQNMGLKKGLAYNVSTSYSGDYNCGEFNANANVPANRIDEAVDILFGEIERIKTQRVPDKTVDRIKRSAKYNIAKTFESNEGHISAIEMKLDKGFTPEIFMEGYDKVTPERILEVANKYLPDQKKGNYVLYIGDPLKK